MHALTYVRPMTSAMLFPSASEKKESLLSLDPCFGSVSFDLSFESGSDTASAGSLEACCSDLGLTSLNFWQGGDT